MPWIDCNATVVRFLTAAAAHSGGISLPAQVNASDYDGRRFVAITDKDGTSLNATVWDAKSGAMIRRIDGHREGVVSVQLAPNGHEVLTSSYRSPGEVNIPSKDDSIRLWDLSTGKQRLFITDATYGRFSHDGKRILGLVRRSGKERNSLGFDIAAWDARTGKRLFTAKTPGDGAGPYYNFTLQESSNAQRLLFCQSRQARVYNSRTGAPVNGVFAFRNGGEGFGFISPDGNEIQFATDRYVVYLSVADGAEIKRVPIGLSNFSKFGWRPDGRRFACVSFTGDVMTYNRVKDRIARAGEKIRNPRSVCVSPDGSCLVVNWWGGTGQPLRARCFDMETCKFLWEKPGSVIGYSKRGEALLFQGSRLSNVNAYGQTVRKIHLRSVDDASVATALLKRTRRWALRERLSREAPPTDPAHQAGRPNSNGGTVSGFPPDRNFASWAVAGDPSRGLSADSTNLIAAIKTAITSAGIGVTPVDGFSAGTGGGESFVSSFVAYHAVWYQASYPSTCKIGFHTDVDYGLTLAQCQTALCLQLKAAIKYLGGSTTGTCPPTPTLPSTADSDNPPGER